MRRIIFTLLFLSVLLTVSCSTSTPADTPPVVTVYSTSAAEPWLADLYACAGTDTVLSRVDDPAVASIQLQVGEPAVPSSFIYQIDLEEVLIVTHRQSPAQNLTLEQAQALFAGHGDPAVQVWVYASDVDVQRVFDQSVMEGSPVTPSAMLAVSAQHMSDTLVNEANAVGILPAHWKMGDSRVVYSIPNIPVLVVTNVEPVGVIKDLVACLQN